MKLLLCTLNENKIKEITLALKDLPIEIITLFNLKDNENHVETGLTLEENSFLKAKHYGSKHQLLALGDDTGLQVDFLSGAPGVYTNRYEKTAELRNKKLLNALKDTNNKKANFKTVFCLYNPLNENKYYFTGILEGFITESLKGENGFGYDPIFYLKEHNKTLAELTMTEKNELSHRGKAVKLLKEFLNENINNIWHP